MAVKGEGGGAPLLMGGPEVVLEAAAGGRALDGEALGLLRVGNGRALLGLEALHSHDGLKREEGMRRRATYMSNPLSKITDEMAGGIGWRGRGRACGGSRPIRACRCPG